MLLLSTRNHSNQGIFLFKFVRSRQLNFISIANPPHPELFYMRPVGINPARSRDLLYVEKTEFARSCLKILRRDGKRISDVDFPIASPTWAKQIPGTDKMLPVNLNTAGKRLQGQVWCREMGSNPTPEAMFPRGS